MDLTGLTEEERSIVINKHLEIERFKIESDIELRTQGLLIDQAQLAKLNITTMESQGISEIQNLDLDYKFKIGDWVSLKLLAFPFCSTSLGKIKTRSIVQHINPFWAQHQEMYEVELWVRIYGQADKTITFPARRLKLDKERILKAKLLGEETP